MTILRLWFASVCFVMLCPAFCAVWADELVPMVPTRSSAQISQPKPDKSLVAVPEPNAKALQHYRSSLELMGLALMWNLSLPVLFLFTGFSARLRSWAERWRWNWYGTFALYLLAFGLLYFLASLPLNYYAEYIQPHSYDLSNQTVGRWLENYVKGAAVTMVLGLAVGWVPFLVIKKSPGGWWFYLSLLALPFLCLHLLIEPVLIDPIFHKFQPLQDQVLEKKILDEAARAGIVGSRIYEVNMSADTKTLNAYVTGFLGTKRIVLWDNTLKKLDEDEVLFVLGHEMGHYVMGHLVKIMVFQSALILFCLYGAHRLSGPLIGRFKRRWGFSAPWDFSALPLGILGVWICAFAVLPIWMAFSRHLEHEADRFGLELTHSNHAAATAFVKLQQAGLGISRPGTLVKFWLYSHPPIGERIDFCNQYRPWETGQPPRDK